MRSRTALSSLALSLCLGTPMLADAPGVPDYSQTPRAQVPEPLTWKVSDLFPSEAAWRKELEAVKAELPKVVALGKTWTQNAGAMAAQLEGIAGLQQRFERLSSYASRLSDTDMANSAFQKLKGEVQAVAVGFSAQLAFVESDVLTLGEAKVNAFIDGEPRLKPFAFNLRKTLRGAKHVLPEGEQRIASMAGLFEDAPSKASGLLNNLDLPRPEITLQDGTKVTLTTAAFQRVRTATNVEDRRKAMTAFFEHQRTFGSTFAALMDGAIQNHHFHAQIRKHDSALSAALYDNAIDPAVYRNLIAAVRSNLAPMHRLIKLRQKLLGLPEFRYSDIYASAVGGVSKTYTYDQAQKLVIEACAPLGKPYQDVLRKAFSERWVDVYPNAGKRSGAYSADAYGVHPFVLMNYDGSFREVSTLAHELGHSLHSWFSNQAQPYATANYPIFLAEIASTFNENLLIDQILRTEKDDTLKLYYLDKHLENLRGTLYRQTLFADFELAMHEQVERGQTLTKDWLDAKYLELTRLYYGHDQGVVKVEDAIQSEWSYIPHFYYNFYVYQYATGVIASMALADAVVKEGEPARARYLGFLQAGGSAYPLDTLKKAGVDLTQRATLDRAFVVFGQYVDEMERLVARLGK